MKRFFQPYAITPIQRAFLVPYFAIGSILDPTQGERVAGLGDITAVLATKRMLENIVRSDEGRELMKNKPLITTESLDYPRLRKLSSNTLGYNYVKFMDFHGFTADGRALVRFETDEDLAYVMTRYRQIHDFWHTLFDMPISEFSEIALKWFEFKVTGLPVCAMSRYFGPMRLSLDERRKLRNVYVPWAEEAARAVSSRVMTYPYEKHLDDDINDVRKALNILMPPPFN